MTGPLRTTRVVGAAVTLVLSASKLTARADVVNSGLNQALVQMSVLVKIRKVLVEGVAVISLTGYRVRNHSHYSQRWKIGRYRFGIWRTIKAIAVPYASPNC